MVKFPAESALGKSFRYLDLFGSLWPAPKALGLFPMHHSPYRLFTQSFSL